MKIYTKTGDRGTTCLVGGTRVEKDCLRIESYGTTDELNAALGLLVADGGVKKMYAGHLKWLQKKLFDIGALLASEKGGRHRNRIPVTGPDDIKKLEVFIDELQEGLPELKNFILPGSCPSSALAHFARTLCRRAERRIYSLMKQEQDEALETALVFINRLSDYLFVLSRRLSLDCGKEETVWL